MIGFFRFFDQNTMNKDKTTTNPYEKIYRWHQAISNDDLLSYE